MKFKSILLLIIMLLLTSCAKSIATTIPEDDEWIMVSRLERGWFWDIYGINANDPQAIVSDIAFTGDQLDWSPDRQWLVYSTGDKVYIAKNNGTSRMKVAEGNEPVWSPKDNLILYTLNGEIYLLDVNCFIEGQPCDTQPALLTVGRNADWSPDGTRITFELKDAIYLVNIDTADVHELFAPQNGGCLEPDWSPISDRIVFRCWGDYEGFYTVNSDGTDLTEIETGEAGGVFPKWSPSGERVAFISYLSINSIEGARSAIYVVNTDSTGLKRLTLGNNDQILWFSWMPPHMMPETCATFCQ